MKAIPRRSDVHAGDGRAQSAQGGCLHASVPRRADQHAARRRALGITLSTETTLTIQSILVHQHGHAVPRHPLHLVARRRNGAVHHGPAWRGDRAGWKTERATWPRCRSSITTPRRRSTRTRSRRSPRSCRFAHPVRHDYPFAQAGNGGEGARRLPASRRRACGRSIATTRSSCFRD